jgi:hypothetical protein
MKKTSVSGVLFAIAVTVGLLFANANIQAQTGRKQDGASRTESATEKKECRNLADFLKAEFRGKTKTEEENPKVRLYGLQEKDAMQKALDLCAKLKAKEVKNDSGDLLYELPEGLGTVILQEVDKDGIFLKLTFATDCESLPFNELWYVTLNRYNGR